MRWIEDVQIKEYGHLCESCLSIDNCRNGLSVIVIDILERDRWDSSTLSSTSARSQMSLYSSSSFCPSTRSSSIIRRNFFLASIFIGEPEEDKSGPVGL